jgi:hypothetical protein
MHACTKSKHGVPATSAQRGHRQQLEPRCGVGVPTAMGREGSGASAPRTHASSVMKGSILQIVEGSSLVAHSPTYAGRHVGQQILCDLCLTNQQVAYNDQNVVVSGGPNARRHAGRLLIAEMHGYVYSCVLLNVPRPKLGRQQDLQEQARPASRRRAGQGAGEGAGRSTSARSN